MKQLVLGTLLGGIIVFAWGAVSWMVLPWHASTMRAFTSEQAVASAIRANAPLAGVYLLPNAHAQGKSSRETERAAHERMKHGPVMLAVIRPSGADPDAGSLYLKGLLVEMAGALMMSLILLSLPGLRYSHRVRIVTLVALAAGVLCRVSDWHWWGFSTNYTLTNIADTVIGWFLASLVIAKVVHSE